MLDKDRITEENSLRLKRAKPFNSNKNTLEKCMLKSNNSISNIDQNSYIDSDSNSGIIY